MEKIKKLTLRKETIADLSVNEMNSLKGGYDTKYGCPTWTLQPTCRPDDSEYTGCIVGSGKHTCANCPSGGEYC